MVSKWITSWSPSLWLCMVISKWLVMASILINGGNRWSYKLDLLTIDPDFLFRTSRYITLRFAFLFPDTTLVSWSSPWLQTKRSCRPLLVGGSQSHWAMALILASYGGPFQPNPGNPAEFFRKNSRENSRVRFFRMIFFVPYLNTHPYRTHNC